MPLHICWALLRNVRTLYGCASQVGQKGEQRGGSSENIALQAAERDIEVTSTLAGSAAEVCTASQAETHLPLILCWCLLHKIIGTHGRSGGQR